MLDSCGYQNNAFRESIKSKHMSCVFSAVVFAMVKTEVSTAGIDSTIAISDSEKSPLLNQVTKY